LNLVLRNGYDIAFVAAAVCYTETPATIKGFLKQQQRWKAGKVAECERTGQRRSKDDIFRMS